MRGNREIRFSNLAGAMRRYLADGGNFYDLQVEAQLAVREVDISVLRLSPRVQSVLRDHRIFTINDLRGEGIAGIHRLAGLGQVGISEIVSALNKKGIQI